jgi:hypothetical protein
LVRIRYPHRYSLPAAYADLLKTIIPQHAPHASITDLRVPQRRSRHPLPDVMFAAYSDSLKSSNQQRAYHRQPTICKSFNNAAAGIYSPVSCLLGHNISAQRMGRKGSTRNSKRETASSVRAAMRSWLRVMKIRRRRSFGRSSVVISIAANTRRLAGGKARRRSRRGGRSRLAWSQRVGRVVNVA